MKWTFHVARALQSSWAEAARHSLARYVHSLWAPDEADAVAMPIAAGALADPASEDHSTRARLTAALSVLGAALATGFAVICARRGLPAVAAGEGMAALLMVINLHYLKQAAKREPFALSAIVVSALTVLLGATGTGVQALFWLYTIPMLSYFLLGLRAGVVINLLVTVGYLLLLAIAPLDGDPTHAARLDMFFSYVLIGIFAYLYERARSSKEAELLHLSNTDALTGAMNRRLFTENLRREVEKSRRYRLPLSMLMIDVDHFKRVNDTCGHDGGDRVLQETARRIAGGLRQADYLVRYGGEEFLVLAPGIRLDQACAMAEKIRLRMAEGPFGPAGAVTVSIGVAELGLEDSAETFVRRADRALYQAKWAGRDRAATA